MLSAWFLTATTGSLRGDLLLGMIETDFGEPDGRGTAFGLLKANPVGALAIPVGALGVGQYEQTDGELVLLLKLY